MFFSNRIKKLSMNDATAQLAADSNIALIDVRTCEEYTEGHIPLSINIPLAEAHKITAIVPNLSTRLFVYCLSGARSSAACSVFDKSGYTDITNIGGISAYTGNLKRGTKI